MNTPITVVNTPSDQPFQTSEKSSSEAPGVAPTRYLLNFPKKEKKIIIKKE